MREIVVISGKGGSGKTTVTAALAQLISAEEPMVLCDFDVDAPDLHILAKPENTQSEAFISGNLATFDPEECIDCEQCVQFCAFGAISQAGEYDYRIDETACEGCKVCVKLCPMECFKFEPRHCGESFVSQTRFGTFVHAQLTPGAENSGRLITLLKEKARRIATQEKINTILCDGTPGIGCPVISSLSGASMAVIVLEATPSGLADFERVSTLCRHFRVPIAVVLNKAGLNDELGMEILEKACALGARHVGSLPFDAAVPQAMIATETLIDQGGALSDAMVEIWSNLKAYLKEKESTRRRTISIRAM